MACDAVTDYVVRESGRYLPNTIRGLTFPHSPIMTLMPRGEFPNGMGQSLNTLIWERSVPISQFATQWQTVTTIDVAEGGSCLPPTHKLKLGNTTRSVDLEQIAFEGPDFCAVDIASIFEISRQLDQIATQLAEYNKFIWEQKDIYEYFLNCKYKVIANGCPPYYSSTIASSYDTANQGCATDTLSMGLLNYFKQILMWNGAEGLARENGMPILTVLTSWAAFENIKFQNDDYRQDIRWGEPNLLLRPFGTPGSYRGFNFVCVPWPRRFNCSDQGVLTEVLPFTEAAASKGFKGELNTSYLTAELEESFIFEQSVCTQLVPSAVTNPHGMFSFKPVDYTGNWAVLNIQDRVCNPMQKVMYHRCEMMAGTLPEKVERGVAILHLRCDPPCQRYTTCAS